ncbi:TIGR04282 family arsenosugar biosynthesis glycosyltransferase [Couchioplanes caeruleus]|uniref:Glycosyltransferase involved in cell wall biogenesis n=2 Tax=Couchioplanes caeruleus TaxID=56438 RepID=A0A1K0GKI9_9ACTN|nr:DUF2064 domain-containing protein [Couchioplanes caeruleus]OJF09707.1 glycosyltransferase involved in cell wall biogenesis [Couchioplanes caeruleus subsp. caeruleus]ROP30494.1 hypothetical protein EDD30_3349 [Couchioplanes caeruleus]
MTQVLVLAKTPVPGRVKTRLCPPLTYEQAAEVAAAALADTLTTVTAFSAAHQALVIDGDHPAPAGWRRVPQRGGPLAERLVNAFSDTAGPPTVLVGMDTPQLTSELLGEAADLAEVDATLGLAEDGGWWALGLRDARHANVLRTIATSTSDTGVQTHAALRRRGLRVALLPILRDVDTTQDARIVAAACSTSSRFRRTVQAVVK